MGDGLRLERACRNDCVVLVKASCLKEVMHLVETPWKGTDFPVTFSPIRQVAQMTEPIEYS